MTAFPGQRQAIVLGILPFGGPKNLRLNSAMKYEHYSAPIRMLDHLIMYVHGMCAANYRQGRTIRAAFVSTNSIIQGEQVTALWKPLIYSRNIILSFGYRSLRWTNEARDMANGLLCHFRISSLL